VARALESVEGVVDAVVRYEDERATVEARAPACTARSFDRMNDALAREGYEATVREVR
jgi:hypothetical protein